MTFVLRCLLLVAASLLACSSPALAQVSSEGNVPFVSKSWRAIYDVGADGRVAETMTTRYQVLHESALERMKVASFSFSTSIQTGEVLEAFTLKKDGRQVVVPAGNYQTEVNDGRRGAGPMFSDRTRISVVFPDLAVGDTVHFSYRLVEKEPMFPGQFSLATTFSPYVTYEDALLTVRVPKDMKLDTEAYFTQGTEGAVADGKRTLEWRYQNLKPRPWSDDDQGIWRIDEFPGVFVSTFPSYEAIAKAYGERALPKAEPTARVRELAQQVVGSEGRPRERARLLYEWVSKNITYGGNCIGVGAVVPRDLDVVLDNRMGDCKDHATLLQALWSAAGLRSEQVLVNAGDQYDLARIPVVSMVNHVMNFLPDFNLYADATAKEVPFGYLPGGSYGKPVIHVGAAKALATLPSQQHEKAEQRLHMTLKMADNGSATGALRFSIKGLAAANARASMRNLTGDAERDFVKRSLAGYGYKGRGTVTKGDTSGLSDQYDLSIEFEIDNFLEGGASGAFVFAPVIATPIPVMSYADVQQRNTMKRRQPCFGFHSYESYDIQLPPGLTLISLPPNAQLRGRLVDFTAKYQRTKAGVTVTRELHDKTSDSICSPETSAELVKQGLPVAENLRTQVLYKRKR